MTASRNRALVLFALCLAAFLMSVDITIVNVTLPTRGVTGLLANSIPRRDSRGY